MTERGDARSSAEIDEYYYRRPLRAGELLPAIAVGVAAGFVAFYVTSLFQQRTPLVRGPRRRRGDSSTPRRGGTG